ncbi:NlpC/P60 family protein [Streptomyces aidingensis]|uniref:Cell wall-associated hydrolase, NlpC family n=1 Tax=Streptomyces aidingensis TaxID=910347 RepID=A0A1I1EC10_9ACTN|nr:C40 family peptidase [Streptomyces aidingensis]SFB84587.1 Cell wall-associated hydrolase, NlpC family [Streptomyces aidingensis]
MGAHRKPRQGLLDSPAARRGAIGLGTAALSATLFAQGAHADDEAEEAAAAIEEQRQKAEGVSARAAEVKEQVDTLYHEAGVATQDYLVAEEATAAQQETVNELLEQAARATEQVNEARRSLGRFAAAQYRHGNGSETATLLLVDDPQSYFDTQYVLGRATEEQQRALDDFTERRAEADTAREEAGTALENLQEQQGQLQERKEEVQGKLAAARELLESLSEEETAELAELERLEREEAERQAEERRLLEEQRQREEQERLARERAAAEAAAEAAAQEEAAAAQEEAEAATDSSPGSSSDGSGSADSGTGDASGGYAAKAAEAIAFAEAQLGKPYVWGATGPNSYDCSGLTQAAWRAAGVELPRVTYDQVNAGTRISRDAMLPGDLVFFYSDISHVGIYIGDGMMIHAPKPGDVIKVESVDYMPFYAAVRPA